MGKKLVERTKGRIVLYYPRLWQPQWPMWAPLDMFAIQTALMHAGYEVTFIDERIDPEARDWLRQEIPGALFVGISGKFGEQCRHMLEAAEFVKEVDPNCKVVAGGWFPSLFPTQVAGSPSIDLVVQGPGDFSVCTLADHLLEGRSLEGIPGIWYSEGGEVRGTPFGHLPRLADTHTLAWEEVGIGRYLHPHGWINYFSSRGCPGGCRFCAIYCLDPHRWTALPAERVVDEMQTLKERYGAQAFKILDTDFMASERRVLEICRLLLERGLRVRFEVLGRHWNMRRLDEDQIRLLRHAGCTEIEMGVESGSQRLSEKIDKMLRVDEVYEVVERYVRNGIRIKVNIMLGIPGEEREDLAASMKVIADLRRLGEGVRLQVFRYTPLPDAPMNKEVWEQRTRGHDGHTPDSLEELLALPINDEPTHMHWLSETHERDVQRAFYFYAPLAWYHRSIEYATRGMPVWGRVLRALRPLARWRTLRGEYRFPFEWWLNRRFGRELPRGEDDGIGPPDDILPAPAMGDSLPRAEPLPEPVGMGVGVGAEELLETHAPLVRPDQPARSFWVQ